jgi:hypothetical protein
MVRQRSSFDPLLPVDEARWLCLRRLDNELIESSRIEPRVDLKAVFVRALAALLDANWALERFSSDLGCAFCRRGSERRVLAIECFDPKRPPRTRGTLGPR